MAFTAHGLDAQALCRAAGVDTRLLADPDARVPLHEWGALWRTAQRKVDDPYLGLHVGAVAPLDPYLIPGYAFSAAPSMAEFARHHLVLQRITFHSDFFSLREERELATLVFAGAPAYAPTRHAVEYTAVTLARYFRRYFEVVPQRVVFHHPPPSDSREHSRVLGCPVSFARAENAFLLRREDFERRRPIFSEATYDRLSAAGERALDDVPAPSFRDQVRAVLRRRLGRGVVDVDSVSRGLHVSARTLQRRLTAEGTRFQRLLDAERHEIAVDQVRRGKRVREAAKAAGFAESASFCRAFRRWTGRTPEQFRGRGGR